MIFLPSAHQSLTLHPLSVPLGCSWGPQGLCSGLSVLPGVERKRGSLFLIKGWMLSSEACHPRRAEVSPAPCRPPSHLGGMSAHMAASRQVQAGPGRSMQVHAAWCILLSVACGGQPDLGSGWAGVRQGTLATALGSARLLTSSVLAPDSGRLPKASLVSLALGALLVSCLAGLAWMAICRW